jgi:pimeloyl-ACP methyl ester carboxylesterase
MEMATNSAGGKTLRLRDGRLLGYAEYGDPQGKPVFGLHGMPGSRFMMKTFQEAALAAGALLVAPERPGYGLSSPHPQGTMVGYAEDVMQLADVLGFDHFAVLGVSGGGPYALACAYKLAQRLSACAVVSGIGPLTLPNSLQGMVRTNRIMFTLGRLSPTLTGLLLPRLIKLSLSSTDKHVQHGTSPVQDLSPEAFAIVVTDQREAIRSGGKGVVFDMKALWQAWSFRIEEVQTRVLLWHGEADNLAPTVLAHYLAAHLPHCQAVFYAGEGHTDPLIKHADEILRNVVAPPITA